MGEPCFHGLRPPCALCAKARELELEDERHRRAREEIIAEYYRLSDDLAAQRWDVEPGPSDVSHAETFDEIDRELGIGLYAYQPPGAELEIARQHPAIAFLVAMPPAERAWYATLERLSLLVEMFPDVEERQWRTLFAPALKSQRAS